MNDIDFKKMLGKSVDVKHGLALLGIKGEVLRFLEDDEVVANAYRLGYALLDSDKRVLHFTADETTKTIIEKDSGARYSARYAWQPWEKELLKKDLLCWNSAKDSLLALNTSERVKERGMPIDLNKIHAMRSIMKKALDRQGLSLKRGND